MSFSMEWTKMSQKELDKQYSPSQWCQRMAPSEVVETHVRVLRQGTLRSQRDQRQRGWKVDLDVAYDVGDLKELKKSFMDMYYPEMVYPNTPLFLYLHGGYWMALDKDASAWFAELITQNNGIFCAVNYDLCPEVSLPTIVEQIRFAVAWVHKKFPGSPIHIAGHSAGAQLCAAILCTPSWLNYSVEDDIRIASALLVSGVYDLTPIQCSCINTEGVNMDDVMVEEASVDKKLDRFTKNTRIYIAVGEHDSPEFQRQSQQLKDGLDRNDHRMVHLIRVAAVDHFDIVERIGRLDYMLSSVIVSSLNALDSQCPK